MSDPVVLPTIVYARRLVFGSWGATAGVACLLALLQLGVVPAMSPALRESYTDAGALPIAFGLFVGLPIIGCAASGGLLVLRSVVAERHLLRPIDWATVPLGVLPLGVGTWLAAPLVF